MLEEILMKHQFDFKVATREFVKEINKEDQENFFSIDVKTLQLRWTDIEIRNHRLGDTKTLNDSQNVIEDDLPQLENQPEAGKRDKVNAMRINGASANRHLLTPISHEELQNTNVPESFTRSNLFNYYDDSSDEEDEKKPKATHYNDLEELD